MADWVTVSQFATAAGTLVLAGATFMAVRSANTCGPHRRALADGGTAAAADPVATTDPPMKVLWSDSHFIRLDGGRAHVEIVDDVIYLAMGVRNAGTGMAVLHGWHTTCAVFEPDAMHADPEEFRRLNIDLYVPAGEPGFWESAIRGRDDSWWSDGAAASANATVPHRRPLRRPGGRTTSRQPLLVVPAATTTGTLRPAATGTSTAPTPGRSLL